MTRHGIYPSLPASPGVPWSAYVRSQRVGSRSVSSSTDALDSDQVPYILSTDREYRSDSGLSDKYTARTPIATGVSRTSYKDYRTEHDDYATLGNIMPTSSSAGKFVNPRTKSVSSCGSPIPKDNAKVEIAVSTTSHPIIGESATVFTDMTDTVLKVLDR